MNWNAVDWYACRIYSLVPRLNAERVYGGELKRGGETPQVLEKGSLWFEIVHLIMGVYISIHTFIHKVRQR